MRENELRLLFVEGRLLSDKAQPLFAPATCGCDGGFFFEGNMGAEPMSMMKCLSRTALAVATAGACAVPAAAQNLKPLLDLRLRYESVDQDGIAREAQAITTRPQSIRGGNMFAFVSHPTPIATLTVFAVLLDQKEPIESLYRQSSKTVGARLAGSRTVAKESKLTYALSYARQSDHARNPNDFRSGYVLTEFGLDVGAFKLGLGREVLGADDGIAFTSFQTPLATLHKFQGWADKFLTAPPNGIKDLYGSAGYGWKKVGGLDAINAIVVYHRFDSDRLDIHYGNEWNASLAAKKGKWTVLAKLADYQAKRFATDTRKAWLQLEYAY